MVKSSTLLVGLLGLWQIVCLVRICHKYGRWAMTVGVTYSIAEIIAKTSGTQGLERYHVPFQGALIGVLSATEDTASPLKSINTSSETDRLLEWKDPEKRDMIDAVLDPLELYGTLVVVLILSVLWAAATVPEREEWELDTTKDLDFENMSGFIVLGLAIVYGIGFHYNLMKTKTIFFFLLFVGTLTGVFLAFATVVFIYFVYYVGKRPRLFSITVTITGLTCSAIWQTFKSLKQLPSIFAFPAEFKVPKIFSVAVFHIFTNSTRRLPYVLPYRTQQTVFQAAKMLFAKATMFALAHSLTYCIHKWPDSSAPYEIWDDCVIMYCGGYLLVGLTALFSYYIGLGMWLTAAGACVTAVLILVLQPSTASWLIIDDLLFTVNFATVLS